MKKGKQGREQKKGMNIYIYMCLYVTSYERRKEKRRLLIVAIFF